MVILDYYLFYLYLSFLIPIGRIFQHLRPHIWLLVNYFCKSLLVNDQKYFFERDVGDNMPGPPFLEKGSPGVEN